LSEDGAPLNITPKRQTFSPDTDLVNFGADVLEDLLDDEEAAETKQFLRPSVAAQEMEAMNAALPRASFDDDYHYERKNSSRQLNIRRERAGTITNVVSSLREMQSSVSLYDGYTAQWVQATNAHELIHESISSFMKRPEELLLQNTTFKSRFEEECNRSFVHVHTQSGTLEITPMQALHLPQNENFLVARVSYGEEV
jgi:hypothetical protein